jgi:hypothetical protein
MGDRSSVGPDDGRGAGGRCWADEIEVVVALAAAVTLLLSASGKAIESAGSCRLMGPIGLLQVVVVVVVVVSEGSSGGE